MAVCKMGCVESDEYVSGANALETEVLPESKDCLCNESAVEACEKSGMTIGVNTETG